MGAVRLAVLAIAAAAGCGIGTAHAARAAFDPAADDDPGDAPQAPPGALWREATDAALHEHRTWRRLLHIDSAPSTGGRRSEIVNEGFHLVDAARFSARDELVATLRAFAKASAVAARAAEDAVDRPDADLDADVRCRYRARWLWLASRLPGTFLDAGPRCPAFERWARLEAVRSLSVLHVSGHFGNPASAFGHLLLRLDSGDPDGARGLTDLGVNFGARVPPGDNGFVYVLKGLFGGYDAGFLDQAFHAHDAVYSATEQRDMWAYELALKAHERELLLSHLWELTRARFDYYFLKYNCARYLSSLLELVLDEPFRPRVQPWHLPQSVLERLEEIDASTPRDLISRVRFVPSLEREAIARFEALDARGASAANAAIAGDLAPDTLEDTGAAELDFLLAWSDYRRAGASGETRDGWGAARRRVLAERLRLPPSPPRSTPVVAPLPPPAGGPSARTLRLGASSSGKGSRLLLGIAPYAYDLANENRGGLQDADFRLLDASIAIDADEDAVTLRSLDLIAVEKLAPPPAAIHGEPRGVWRLSATVHGEDPSCASCDETGGGLTVGGGLGRATALSGGGRKAGRTIAYAYLDATLGTARSAAGPAVGLLHRAGRGLALRLESRRLRTSEGEFLNAHRGELFGALGRQHAVRLTLTRVDTREEVRFGVSWRW